VISIVHDEGMCGGLPDFLIGAIGAILIIDAMHLHSLHESLYCFAGSLIFSAGVVSVLSLACVSLSRLCCFWLNMASVFLLSSYLALWFSYLGFYSAFVHVALLGMVCWFWFIRKDDVGKPI
jgi:hypothetical protein